MLNMLLRAGKVDLSPSSSIEFLRNADLYTLIEGHSVSSRGPVGSILLFADRKIEALDGTAVYVSSQSETSIGLLAVIARKFYGVEYDLRISDYPQITDERSFLLIGDDALRHWNAVSTGQGSEGARTPFVYDLGDLWYRYTGLPFVFALWMVRRQSPYADGLIEGLNPAGSHTGTELSQSLLDRFVADLGKARGIALTRLHELARHVALRSFMSESEILRYWDRLDYDLSDDHKRGLKLFGDYLGDLSYFTKPLTA
jgi:chorismate dehydratase